MNRLGDDAEAEDRPLSRPPCALRGTARQPVIMIADDTTDPRELYAEYFRARDFTVVMACDGPSVIQVALDHHPDVIVIDLEMPQFDGITVIRKLKEDDRTRHTRVILLTGFPMTQVAGAAREAGADVYLTKPCLPDKLERHVNELRVAELVERNAPNALCFACLALQLSLREHDVRAVALGLITRVGLQYARHACSSCHRTEELLRGSISA